MRDVLERELAGLTSRSIKVTGCAVQPTKSRKRSDDQRQLIYYLSIEIDGASAAEYTLLGSTPAPDDALDDAVATLCRATTGHAALAPFERSFHYIPELQMSLLFFPVDPALPALVEATGAGASAILASHLPECSDGASVEDVVCEPKHYKPGARAVLRLCARLRTNGDAPLERVVYAKLFADDRGAQNLRALRDLWAALRDSSCVRLPEPLGYDADRRMVLIREVTGGHDLDAWIKRLEKGQPLPDGVTMEQMGACMVTAARALCEIHGSGLQLDGRRTFEGALENVHEDLPKAIETQPELAAMATDVLARLERQPPSSDLLVPSHGGFRHKQMTGDESCLSVVDWDDLAMAHPAMDAAQFITRLRQVPIRTAAPDHPLQIFAESFRRTFLAGHPHMPPGDLASYEALALVEKAVRACRRPSSSSKKPLRTRRLLDEAAALVAR